MVVYSMSKKQTTATTTKYSLVIVESPAKCKKIKDYLGPGYECEASFGHVRELPNLSNIQMGDGSFIPTYTNMKAKLDQIKVLKNKSKSSVCKEVIIATDDDREGEAIGWHLCVVLKLNPATTKRIIFHEITRPAIQQAICRPGHIDMARVEAQQCRQILDLLVGFTISPKLWKAFTYQINGMSHDKPQGLSAGRCQTPALRLVYDNHLELEANPGVLRYKITGHFTKYMLPCVLNRDLEYETDCECSNSIESFLTASQTFSHCLSVEKPVLSIRSAPKPLTTASLLQLATNELHMGPKETMHCAQSLYEHGLITYMRTDSEQLSIEFLDAVMDACMNELGFIQKSYKQYLNPHLKEELGTSSGEDAGAGASAHEAIRPVSIKYASVDTKRIDVSERVAKLYSLIWKRTMEACMGPAQVHVIRAKITAPLDHYYTFATENVVFWGWKCVNSKRTEMTDEYQYLHRLSQTTKANEVQYSVITASPHLVQTKGHLTEAKLIQLLKDRGIGRPSTFAMIIDKIQEKKYVQKQDIVGQKKTMIEYSVRSERPYISTENKEFTFGNEKGKLVIQPLGVLVSEFCIKRWPNLFAYEYTNDMENKLDVIAAHKETDDNRWTQYCVPLCKGCVEQMVQEEQSALEDDKMLQIHNNKKFGVVVKDADNPERKLKLMVSKNGLVIVDRTDETADKPLFIPVRKDINLKMEALEKVQDPKQPLLLADIQAPTLEQNAAAGDADVDIALEEADTKKTDANNSILRTISKEINIRAGKSGKADYIYYKTIKMKKPKFISLAKCPHNYLLCDEQIIKDMVK